MDLSMTTKTVNIDNREWLANANHYENIPGTLDLASFTDADHYPNGHVTSGILVGKITASGLYGPYDNAAADGREEAAGYIWEHVDVTSGANNHGFALMVHGFVTIDLLPTAGAMTNGGHDAAADADLPMILAMSL